MSALDRPTADELARDTIAAAVRNGELTPQQGEAQVRDLDHRRPRFIRAALSSGLDVVAAMGEARSTSADPIVSQVEFARLAQVSPGRVARWIAEGQISGRSLVGGGCATEVRVSEAFADLRAIIPPAYRPATPTAPSARRAG